jgi:predicted Zn-dependent protease
MKNAIIASACLPLLLTASAVVGIPQRSAESPPDLLMESPPWDFRKFSDPAGFFEQFFGADSDADRERLERTEVSLAEERAFGNRVVQAFLAELRRNDITVTSRGKDVDYLRRLVGRVQPVMEHAERYPSWQIYIAEASPIEAKCFPGGTLVFFRGLLDSAESEATLVGVIAHELSHLDHGHQLNMLRRMKIAEQTFAGKKGFDPRTMFQNGPMLLRAFVRPFRPEDESQADLDATRWMFKLGYDPREFARLFLRMKKAAGPPVGLAAILPSHPPHEDRNRAVLEELEDLNAASPDQRLYAGRENLRRRVTRSEREFPE